MPSTPQTWIRVDKPSTLRSFQGAHRRPTSPVRRLRRQLSTASTLASGRPAPLSALPPLRPSDLLSALRNHSFLPTRHVYLSGCPSRWLPARLARLARRDPAKGGGVSIRPDPPQCPFELTRQKMNYSQRPIISARGRTRAGFGIVGAELRTRSQARTARGRAHAEFLVCASRVTLGDELCPAHYYLDSRLASPRLADTLRAVAVLNLAWPRLASRLGRAWRSGGY